MMKKSDLDFNYPNDLTAIQKRKAPRVMFVKGKTPEEINLADLILKMKPPDLLIINNTKVIPARIHSLEGLEILFIEKLNHRRWKVLCPAKKWPKNQVLKIPGIFQIRLVQKKRTQIIEVNEDLDEKYFLKYGDLPIPPYIQQARGERKSRSEDQQMYQSAWAEKTGSLAAPTASLHFSMEDLKKIKARKVLVKNLCLHVGCGTFLPIHRKNPEDHKMHSEWVEIPKETWRSVKNCKESGGRIWALGSTVTRALESMNQNMFKEKENCFLGSTDLFIRPGFNFGIVDLLMTNFHTPQSTLLAMVMAFAGIENVKKNYRWAIERKFQLFSYGDLTVWEKQ